MLSHPEVEWIWWMDSHALWIWWMPRANQNVDTSLVTSPESSRRNSQRLTGPKTPQLQTSLRARPPTLKNSFELELEKLQKIPKFNAKLLNKKIFESKGELGIFCTLKKPVTIPEEFHFATDERIPPTNVVVDMFDKACLMSLDLTVETHLASRMTYLGHRRWIDTNHSWRACASKFNGETEYRNAPYILTGREILSPIRAYEYPKITLHPKVKSRLVGKGGWTHKTIYYVLLYWKTLSRAYSLEVMNIKKLYLTISLV